MTGDVHMMMNREFDEIVAHAATQTVADHRWLHELVEARKKCGLTQKQVAELIGVSQPTVAAFERYDNDPRLSTIRRYAVAVGVLIKYDVKPMPCTGWAIAVDTPVAVVTATPALLHVEEFGANDSLLRALHHAAGGSAADSNRTDFALAS
jgi:DNA-binding XRE family transcriptional regulator